VRRASRFGELASRLGARGPAGVAEEIRRAGTLGRDWATLEEAAAHLGPC
jgi:hypothetical protein